MSTNNLPEPSFIERDLEAIKTRLMADSGVQPADPEYIVLEQIAFEMYVLRCNVQDACKQNLLKYSAYPVLDYLGDLRDTERETDETDADYKSRIPDSMDLFAVAGPEAAYIQLAMAADSRIIDVSPYSPLRIDDTPSGVLELYVHTSDYWTAEMLEAEIAAAEEDKTVIEGEYLEDLMQALLDSVSAAVTPREVRPLDDKVEVYFPSEVTETYDVSITAKEDAPADLESQVQTLADEYALLVKNNLNRDVIESKIKAILNITGVYKVVLDPTTDTTADYNEFVNSTFNVTVTGVTNEE